MMVCCHGHTAVTSAPKKIPQYAVERGFQGLYDKNTRIFAVVLYGCEAWSVILREEHRLRVFENRVLSSLGERG
jgi:hypothetical protein